MDNRAWICDTKILGIAELIWELTKEFYVYCVFHTDSYSSNSSSVYVKLFPNSNIDLI